MNFSKLRFLTLPVFLIVIGCQPQSNQDRTEQEIKFTKSDSIQVGNAWVRSAAEGGNSAAYLQIYNDTSQPDTLIAVKTKIAQKAEVHESYEESGIMGMRPAGKQSIAPDSVLKLQPGGLHIMLMQVDQKLAEGDSVQLYLIFSIADTQAAMVPVKKFN